MLEETLIVKDWFENRQQRLGHNQRLGAAVAQHEIEFFAGEEGIGRDRHKASLDRAEKCGGEVDGVEEA